MQRAQTRIEDLEQTLAEQGQVSAQSLALAGWSRGAPPTRRAPKGRRWSMGAWGGCALQTGSPLRNADTERSTYQSKGTAPLTGGLGWPCLSPQLRARAAPADGQSLPHPDAHRHQWALQILGVGVIHRLWPRASVLLDGTAPGGPKTSLAHGHEGPGGAARESAWLAIKPAQTHSGPRHVHCWVDGGMDERRT